jgi:hypothetical protein
MTKARSPPKPARKMRLALSVDGGLGSFPGLRRPVTVDSARLPPAQAARLCALVDAADFFDVRVPAPAVPAPDARTYTVEIEEGPRRRTLSLTEPIADAALRDLVDQILACGRPPREA